MVRRGRERRLGRRKTSAEVRKKSDRRLWQDSELSTKFAVSFRLVFSHYARVSFLDFPGKRSLLSELFLLTFVEAGRCTHNRVAHSLQILIIRAIFLLRGPLSYHPSPFYILSPLPTLFYPSFRPRRSSCKPSSTSRVERSPPGGRGSIEPRPSFTQAGRGTPLLLVSLFYTDACTRTRATYTLVISLCCER